MYLTHAPGKKMPYFYRTNKSTRYRQGEKNYPCYTTTYNSGESSAILMISRGILQMYELFATTSIPNLRPRDHSWMWTRNPKEGLCIVCSLTERIPISLWIESFICLYSDDGRMYRCPLSIKYKNLFIYSEVTISFHWEIYLVLLIRSY